MKILSSFLLIIACSTSLADSHQTIYTTKLKRIINALPMGNYASEQDYFAILKTACQRNACSKLESQTILSIGQQMTHCKIKHLKVHKIINPDATNICQSKLSIFACDSLATPLLRKMCYSGNQYSLQALEVKEQKINSRQPASQ